MDCYLKQMKDRLITKIRGMQRNWLRFPKLISAVNDASTLSELEAIETMIDEKRKELCGND